MLLGRHQRHTCGQIDLVSAAHERIEEGFEHVFMIQQNLEILDGSID